MNIPQKIAEALGVPVSSVCAAINLLEDGATVPFIARYRKEATGGLDDVQLRFLEERLIYLKELEERRETILKSIEEQGHLTEALKQAIEGAETKTHLEDLYLPYKPKRNTKAQIAREAGLEPLALQLWKNPPKEQDWDAIVSAYINTEKQVLDTAAALEGARQILMEKFSEDAELLDRLREHLWKRGHLFSKVVQGKEKAGNKYQDYFDYYEPIKNMPSHRALALLRGRREGFIRLSLEIPEDTSFPCFGEKEVARQFEINLEEIKWLSETVRLTWKVKIFPKLELELMTRLREAAEEEAIKVFAKNLRDILLAAPAGEKVTIGLDPGIRTGVKVVVVDITGKLLDSTVIYPFPPSNQWHASIAELAKLAAKYHVNLMSIGNGTGSRETDRLVGELIKMYPDLELKKVTVNEAGASVYSASEYASAEFPDLDVSLRGAVSIARRLQDPLAELVKIEPKAIGVGQYQHDVNQVKLSRSLEGVVEDCVNAVGVDVNTASAALLRRVSGLNETLAKNVVEYRDQHGKFQSRHELLSIPRMGEKTFQQCAGFLRVMNGAEPLDASGVHPESYGVVEKIIVHTKTSIQELLGNEALLSSLNAEQFADEQHGVPTVTDIIKELKKPGRDPRPEFRTVAFQEGIETIEHLQKGMILEGVVGNVTHFGAFVDVGVHHNGLVHISEMGNKQHIKAGDIVTVRVVDVDLERQRISLSMRLKEFERSTAKPNVSEIRKTTAAPREDNRKNVKPFPNPGRRSAARPRDAEGGFSKKPFEKPRVKDKPVFNTAMADALLKLADKNESK